MIRKELTFSCFVLEHRYSRRLESRVRKEGYATIGIPGNATTIMIAMMLSSPRIVGLLLESGANFDSVDVIGHDPFMFASMFGRQNNLLYWLERFKCWNLNRGESLFGGHSLSKAVYVCSVRFYH